MTAGLFGWACGPAAAAVDIEGQVQGGGAPIAKSTVTLWAAGEGGPSKLAETTTGDDGAFKFYAVPENANAAVLYLVAKGGQPKIGSGSGASDAIGLMATLPYSAARRR